MATARGAAKVPPQPFVRSLLLPRAFARQVGLRDVSQTLAGTTAARDAAGVSGHARTLLVLAGLAIPPYRLLRWDAAIGTQSLSLPVRGFLITSTAVQDTALPPGVSANPAALKQKRVLLQSDGEHIEFLLRDLLNALTPSAEVTA